MNSPQQTIFKYKLIMLGDVQHLLPWYKADFCVVNVIFTHLMNNKKRDVKCGWYNDCHENNRSDS